MILSQGLNHGKPSPKRDSVVVEYLGCPTFLRAYLRMISKGNWPNIREEKLDLQAEEEYLEYPELYRACLHTKSKSKRSNTRGYLYWSRLILIRTRISPTSNPKIRNIILTFRKRFMQLTRRFSYRRLKWTRKTIRQRSFRSRWLKWSRTTILRYDPVLLPNPLLLLNIARRERRGKGKVRGRVRGRGRQISRKKSGLELRSHCISLAGISKQTMI